VFRTNTRTIFSIVCVVVVFAVQSDLALPASAAGKTGTFCKDIAGVTVVLSPAIPNNDSPNAIATAVSKLPDDVSALKKIHAKMIAATAAAPSPTLAHVFRVAAISVVKESGAITSVINEEAAVLADPRNSTAVIALAGDLVTAISAAAAANAYLEVDHSFIVTACKGTT
jgi:hypothetical protein